MPFTPPGEYPYVNDTSPGAGDGDIVYAEIVNVIMAYLQDVLPIDISEASAADIYHAVLLGRDAPESHPADAIVVDASGFNGNLTTGDDDLQKVAQKVDDLSLGGTYTDENARDAIATALTAGTGITVTPNDGADTITVATTITQYTDEMARDALGTALTAGTGITITPNDGSDIITIAATASGTVDVVSNVATQTILGRNTAGSGDSEELSASTARTVLGLGTAAQSATTDFAPATRTVGTGLSTSGTVDLDMAALHGTIQTITATGTITFTTSNRAAGREVTLVIAAGGSSRTLAWPSWLAVGEAMPTSLASGKTLVASVTFTDTTDAAAIAATSAQP